MEARGTTGAGNAIAPHAIAHGTAAYAQEAGRAQHIALGLEQGVLEAGRLVERGSCVAYGAGRQGSRGLGLWQTQPL